MKKTVFISCGQFTDAEKRLGKSIAEMVRTLTRLEPFFAEEVQDLNGLDANILRALHECVAFITVLHPRGEIARPDKTELTRASVWIEQEIAIATYIHRVENRRLPIIAFKHKSVGREGIRDLLHLNPIEFTREDEVLAELPRHLELWKSLEPSGIELRLTSKANRQQDGHTIRTLELTLVNDTAQRIAAYDFAVRIPSSILKHWTAHYEGQVPSEDTRFRQFRYNQNNAGGVNPRERRRLVFFDYCTACAVSEPGDVGASVADAPVSADAWIDGKEYKIQKTIKQLAEERENTERTRS
jgi:hypothetical protein